MQVYLLIVLIVLVALVLVVGLVLLVRQGKSLQSQGHLSQEQRHQEELKDRLGRICP